VDVSWFNSFTGVSIEVTTRGLFVQN